MGVTMRLLVWAAVLTALVAGWAPAQTAAAVAVDGTVNDGAGVAVAGAVVPLGTAGGEGGGVVGGRDAHAGNGGRRGAAHDGNGPSGGFPLRRGGGGELSRHGRGGRVRAVYDERDGGS